MSTNKLPLSQFIAELNYLEFYQTKTRSADGTYRVIEEDGTVNYCSIVHNPFRESWYSDSEYQDWAVTGHRVMDVFDDSDREDLMGSWDSAMIAIDGKRLADEIPFDEEYDREYNRRLAIEHRGKFEGVDYAELPPEEYKKLCDEEGITPAKSMADLLREAMAKETVLSPVTPSDLEGIQELISDGYRDYTLEQDNL